MTKINKNETFAKKFIRQVIRADFKSNDSILPTVSPTHQLISPKSFLKGSRLARFCERVWAGFAFILFSFCAAAILAGSDALYAKITEAGSWRSWLLAVGIIALFLYSLYVALALFGYLRWMGKVKKKS